MRSLDLKRHRDAALIGRPGGAAEISTPALVIDLPALERNLARMAAHAKASGIALRPHAKTHKSAEIASRQIALGANGVCCAKLAEAEALAARGIKNILLTSPVVTPRALERLAILAKSSPGLIATIDSEAGLAALGEAMRKADARLDVMIDLNIGLGRTGTDLKSAEAMALSLANHAVLRLRGLQAYAGHLMHLADGAERRAKSLAALGPVGELASRLRAQGLAIDIVSGGGTGTYDIDTEAGVFTELQVGSYVFMDREYRDVWPAQQQPFEPALFVRTTVISANQPGLATTDAGLKAFAADAGPPVILKGAADDAKYFFFGDEQGGILTGAHPLTPGHTLDALVPHCDPTVNLYDVYHVVRDTVLVDLWPVDARGASQ